MCDPPPVGSEDSSGTLDAGRRDSGVAGSHGLSGALVSLAIGAWALVLLVGLGYAALVQLSDDTYCPPFEGSSQYGELDWSVLPPGPTCTFTADVHGFDEVRGPTPVMSVWLAVLVVGPAVCLALVRASRLRRSTGT